MLDLFEFFFWLFLDSSDKCNNECKRKVFRWNVDEIKKVKENFENVIEENKVCFLLFCLN